MSHKIKEIEVYLSQLDMSIEKFPTFCQLKKAYRDLLYQKPEEKVFLEISEAARIVFLFMVQNAESRTGKSEEGVRMLKCFETSSHLESHNGSITFDIEDVQYEGWMESLEKRLGPHGPLNGKNSYKFKVENFELPKMGDLGGVTASDEWRQI